MGSRNLKSIMVAMGQLMLRASALAWLIAIPMSAHAADTATFSLDTHILNPPNAVTDLVASPVGSVQGDVQLLWTAPSNLNRVGMSHYFVRLATYPAVNPAAAESWWSMFPGSQRTVSPAHAAGVQEFVVISGLTINVTYYFGIKAVDVDGQISSIDTRVGNLNQAQSLPLNTGATDPPLSPTGLVGVALSTTSLQWTWNTALNANFYRLNTFPLGTLITQTALTTATETGLSPNMPYARTISAGNMYGLSPNSPAETIYTLANAPTSFATTNVGFTTVSLAWAANNNPAGTQYRLERSPDGISFSIHAVVSSTSFVDSGLTELTSYYYRLRALNGDGIATAPTAVVSAFTPLQVDYLKPDAPGGLKGTLDGTGLAFTLTWEAPQLNVDGTPLTDLAGYNIYRRTSVNALPTKITPVPITATAFADSVNNQVYYYTIRAIDTTGNESDESLIADSSRDANIIFLSTDNASYVLMPESVNDLLRSNNNKYGVPLTITLSEDPLPAADTAIVRSIRLNLVRMDTHQVLSDLAFAAPQATVAVGYEMVGGQVGRGAPTGLNVRANAQTMSLTPQQLSLYWYNGVTWVKIGGTLNTNAQTLSTKSSFLGNYQLRGVAAATSLALSQGNVYPRLFSPNGDGLNDFVYFILENPNDANVTGEIVDKEGRHVRTLPPPQSGTGIGTTLKWDGKDDQGNVVPGGAYIYKIQGEGKSFSGTVGVAR